MTLALEQRRRIPPKAQRLTMVDDALEVFRQARERFTGITWPSAKYRDDPVQFFRDVLGVEPWSKQIEIIEAIRDHPRVAVRSGHKISKSHTAAGSGLWFYESFPDARVAMTSTTARQVEAILWRELRKMVVKAGLCVDCRKRADDGEPIARPCRHSALIDGELADTAKSGLKSPDFREVIGFTAREAEAVAGVSGVNLLYIIDEASGVDASIYEAIEGNRAGGARVVLFGNPTRNEGEHFDAFHSKARFYKTFTVSSEETPNVVEGRVVVPGLATREWVEEKREEWGEDSPLYMVRVKGKHALSEDGRIFSIAKITAAEERWYETEPTGRLWIGIDPAGESGTGDEAAFCSRRGFKVLALETHRGLSEEAHLVHALSLIRVHGLRREVPVIVLDAEGAVGAKVLAAFREYLAEQRRAPFELVVVRASDGAVRQPRIYDRMRDELTGNLEQWFREGGAILEDDKLAAELHLWSWGQGNRGRLKLLPAKRDIRKKGSLGRSPDRYDALALAAWEPLALEDDVPDTAPASARRDDDDDHFPEATLDPYAAMDTWRRGR